VIDDKVPEITEGFTLAVTRADGQKQETTYDQDGPLDLQRTARAAVNEAFAEALDRRLADIVTEVLDYERRRSD
jgi:hypothetical protein